jgi:hypothetical protein
MVTYFFYAYIFLCYGECLRHPWYGCCDIWIWYMLVGWLSEKHSYVWNNSHILDGYLCCMMIYA